MQQERILVVGTTSDYIDLLRRKFPEGALLFITAPSVRYCASEENPYPDEEILCNLDDRKALLDKLDTHIGQHGIILKGVACFDCESMELAAHIAGYLKLSYPSLSSVQACRDKAMTRKLWHTSGVRTPEYSRAGSFQKVESFFSSTQMPCVLKPVDGSGSERVFKCRSIEECREAYEIIRASRPAEDIIIESFIDGVEYSCDFIVDCEDGNRRVVPLRFTKKIHSPLPVFGTIMAYEVIAFPSAAFKAEEFSEILLKASEAIGITRGLCMLDFIVRNHESAFPEENGLTSASEQGADGKLSTADDVYLIEIAPRPGGDCLPWLIMSSMNLDILHLALDFAGNREFTFISPRVDEHLVGLRIHADRSGVLKKIGVSTVIEDRRVKDILLKQTSGHRVVMPPDDYDSWNLGHIIFRPSGTHSITEQCMELLSMLEIEIET